MVYKICLKCDMNPKEQTNYQLQTLISTFGNLLDETYYKSQANHSKIPEGRSRSYDRQHRCYFLQCQWLQFSNFLI